jgi:type II secretory pathway pseudopilin PulG
MTKVKLTQGVTLIELMVVIIIIIIIGGLLLGAGQSARRKAMETQAACMIAGLEVAISMYHADLADYPLDGGDEEGEYDNNSDLRDLLSNEDYGPTGGATIAGWRGPYIEFKHEDVDGNFIIDPWGRPYRYAIMDAALDATPAAGITWGNTSSYNIWSIGEDGNNDSGNVDGDTVFKSIYIT